MVARTTESIVTFRRPFKLSAFEGEQPAGRYRLEIDEEQIPGLSFVAYQRVATLFHLPAITVLDGTRQVFHVDFAELETALAADALDQA